MRELILSGTVTACHDLSDGGLLVGIAEMAMAGMVGAGLDATGDHGFWFGEDQGRYVVTARKAQSVLDAAKAAGVSATIIGKTGGEALELSGEGSIPLVTLRDTFMKAGSRPLWPVETERFDNGNGGC